jgi:hypothetical protein
MVFLFENKFYDKYFWHIKQYFEPKRQFFPLFDKQLKKINNIHCLPSRWKQQCAYIHTENHHHDFVKSCQIALSTFIIIMTLLLIEAQP